MNHPTAKAVIAGFLAFGLNATAAEFHVAITGNDASAGTAGRPFATLARAQQAVRAVAGKEPATVMVQRGTYYLPATLTFTAADSGSATAPVVYQAAPGEEAVISGGLRLELKWQPHQGRIFKAATPTGLQIDQLFVNGERQRMARYPNYDPSVRHFNGYAADAFSPQRAARWADPRGGFIHAMHVAEWGDFHYLITGKGADNKVTYEGGWQNNRRMGMHGQFRMVENIFEELDAPGEWYHDTKTFTLYYFPNLIVRRQLKELREDGRGKRGIMEVVEHPVDLGTAVVEVVRLRHLIELRGSAEHPVKFLTLKGLTFRHAARTFMDNKEPLLRSDWTTYRGGAVFFNGSEDCALEDCFLDQLGGNAVFVNNYNRRLAVRGCHIARAGANGVAFVGDPGAVRNPLFEYNERQDLKQIDLTPGPKTPNYPADCLVEDCLIYQSGRVEKQTAPVQIAMAQSITVRHCSLYDVPRAGINIGDGCWGGHVIEFCDVFDTVKETGDHGSFNSWGRDRYWGLKGIDLNAITQGDQKNLPLLDVVKPIILRNNRWRCDHGWDIDLDDGSSNYEIRNNLCLNGGLKLREGFYRVCENNIVVNNSFHPHVWYRGSQDVFRRNIVLGSYRPIRVDKPWGKECDFNLLHRPGLAEAKPATGLQGQSGLDANSIEADVLFVDPAKGDYRVKEGSPALKLGFQNFPMDQFGVRKPALRAIAKTPELPEVKSPAAPSPTPASPVVVAMTHYWLGAKIKELEGEEYSAFGVSKESGGVQLLESPAGSDAAKAGLAAVDLVQTVNGRAVKNIADLLRSANEAAGKPLTVGIIRGQQTRTVAVESYNYFASETTDDSAFKAILLAPSLETGIRQVTARPGTHNESLTVLHDGKVAANYGPVFGNDTGGGLYKADLGEAKRVAVINTWSHNQNGKRGPQRLVVFGSNAPDDPSWEVTDRAKFTLLAEVDTSGTAAKNFLATSIRRSTGKEIGAYRWLVWAVYPVTSLKENTAFQEFQIQVVP